MFPESVNCTDMDSCNSVSKSTHSFWNVNCDLISCLTFSYHHHHQLIDSCSIQLECFEMVMMMMVIDFGTLFDYYSSPHHHLDLFIIMNFPIVVVVVVVAIVTKLMDCRPPSFLVEFVDRYLSSSEDLVILNCSFSCFNIGPRSHQCPCSCFLGFGYVGNRLCKLGLCVLGFG